MSGREVWHDPSAASFKQTFHHISSAVQLLLDPQQCCQMFVTLCLDPMINLKLIKSQHGHFLLNRLPWMVFTAFFYPHTQTRRLATAYNKMFTTVMAQWHCHVVSRYCRPYTSAICRNEGLTLCRQCGTIRAELLRVFSNHDIHHPFSKDISQIHLWCLKASLFAVMKYRNETFTDWAHIGGEALGRRKPDCLNTEVD